MPMTEKLRFEVHIVVEYILQQFAFIMWSNYSSYSFLLDNHNYFRFCHYPSGDKGIRTLDPLLARQVLSHLSYTPEVHFRF